MEKLIWIFILFLIIQKVLARAGSKKRFPVPDKPHFPQESPREDDRPLQGPWSAPSEGEDAVEADIPLSGPWDRGGEKEQRGKPQEGAGMQPEIRIPAAPPPKRKRVKPQEVKHGEDTISGERKREREFTREQRPRRREKSVHPLQSFLADRNSLAASVILGEVINKRGGQQARPR